MNIEKLKFSPYLTGLLEEHPSPTQDSAQDALDALRNIEPKAPDAADKLLKLKEIFALGWSALAIDTTASFQELGQLQSQFAAESIDAALQIAWHKDVKAFKLKNVPHTITGLFILGLGKLGGLDLNFSSDVDLIAFYDPATLPVPEHIGQGYAVNKILKTMSQILKPRNSSRFVWRVDWRLRPEASATQLAMSLDMAQDFYFFRALPWHRLALMKARVIAGDLKCGEDFLQLITPFIWRQNLDFRTIDELAHLKSRINLEHPALRLQREAPAPITEELAGFNVKLGSGGIREIEFIANAKQLIWGGKKYPLRTPNTLNALSQLSKLGHLDVETGKTLQSYYIQLRKLENSIQMLGNEQTHIVPQTLDDQDSIMALLGYKNWEKYSRKIEAIRRFVNTEFIELFETRTTSTQKRDKDLLSEISGLSPQVETLAENWLDGFLTPSINSKNNHKFQSLGKLLLKQIIKSSTETEQAIIQVNNFFSALSKSEQYLSLLSRNKTLLNSLIPPLLHSPHMSVLLQQSPHIIDVFLSPQTELNTDFIFQSNDYETRLERLRRFVNENLFTHYTKFMRQDGSAKALHHHLTQLADMTIQAALRIVSDDLEINDLNMTVLGLGKMGTSRMSPLSDLDLIFIFADTMDTDLAHKMVRRLRTVLTAKLSEGIAYELDMRLRPSGRSGPPAVMLSSFMEHHNERAHNWEHIALRHSRIVAGDEALGRQVIAIRDAVLSRPRDKAQFLSDATTMWKRISDQRLTNTAASAFNSKLRPGGLMQAEYTEACNLILNQDTGPLPEAISFWSHIQLWERLLGLTEQPLDDVPQFYLETLLNQFECENLKDLEKQQQKHGKSVIAHVKNSVGSKQEIDTQESRIIWAD